MKKYLLGLFAIVLAVGFSAFTSPKHTTFTYWVTAETNSTYTLSDNSNDSQCSIGDKLCQFESDIQLTTGLRDKSEIDPHVASPDFSRQ